MEAWRRLAPAGRRALLTVASEGAAVLSPCHARQLARLELVRRTHPRHRSVTLTADGREAVRQLIMAASAPSQEGP